MTDFSYQKQGRSHQWCHSYAYQNTTNFMHRVVGGPFPETSEWHRTWDPSIGGPVRYVADETIPLGGALPSPLARPLNTTTRNYSVVSVPRIMGSGGSYIYQVEVELPRFGNAVTPYAGAPSPTMSYIPILSWGGYGDVPEGLAPSNSELLVIRDAYLLMGHDVQSNKRINYAETGIASAYDAATSLPPRVEDGAGTVAFKLFAASVTHNNDGVFTGYGNPGGLITSATQGYTQLLGQFITNSYSGVQGGPRPVEDFQLEQGNPDKESINAFWSWSPQWEANLITLAPYQCLHGGNLLWTPHVVWLRTELTSTTTPFILSGGRMRVVLHVSVI
jgi:hypothetical protein